jgi:hypothetical protein
MICLCGGCTVGFGILIANIKKLTYVKEIKLLGIWFALPTPKSITIVATIKIHKAPLPKRYR